jgi:hypothetical protein
MPEFMENQDGTAGEGRGLAPDRRRPRRRRNPIACSRKGQEKPHCTTIGPCTIDCEPAVGRDVPPAEGKYSTEMIGEETIDQRSDERRFRRRAGGRDGSRPHRPGREIVARHSGAKVRQVPAAAPGPLGKILRVLWPFGKKRAEAGRQDGRSRGRGRSAPRRHDA